ncbi:MAG: C_GCAxxG_C_C family protein [Bacteroidales bacterium]|nr:C_GCAxxG_C_C family protein [Bacteroidales bacterium]
MNKINKAEQEFVKGFNCSQSVLSVYCEQFGLDRNTAFLLSSAFGGGINKMGEICGAVSGAIMLIGLKYGRIDADDQDAIDRTEKLTSHFLDEFKKRNKFLKCKELLGYDFAIESENEFIKANGLTKQLCPKFVKDAVEIFEEIIKDQ